MQFGERFPRKGGGRGFKPGNWRNLVFNQSMGYLSTFILGGDIESFGW